MAQANQRIFASLRAASPDFAADQAVRYISTTAEEKKWLKSVRFFSPRPLALGPSARLALAQLEDDTYLITIGLDELQTGEELTPLEMNAGLYTAVVTEFSLHPRATETAHAAIRDVFYPVTAPQTGPIDWAQLSNVYPTVKLYRIDRSSVLLSDASAWRVGSYIVSCNPSLCVLPFGSALEKASMISLSAAGGIPHRLVFQSLLEARWESAYLGIYRCIEQLFPLRRVKQLKKSLSLSTATHEVCVIVESELGWRANESAAIEELLCDVQGCPAIRQVGGLFGKMESSALDLAKRVAKGLYQKRNDAVHYRPVHVKAQRWSDDAWRRVISGLFEILEHLYAAYGADVHIDALSPDAFRLTPDLDQH